MRSFLEYDPRHRKVMLAPVLPWRLGSANRTLLADSLCERGSPKCTSGEAWRVRAEAALKAEEAACRSEPRPCEVRRDAIGLPFVSWIACEHDRMGRSIELPSGGVNPPTDGWLVVRHRRDGGDVAASCLVAASFALATGDAWFLDTCARPKVRVGRVPVRPLRELALLLVVGDHVHPRARVRAIEVEVPEGLEPRWVAGTVMGSVTGPIIGHEVAGFPRVSWRAWTRQAEKLGSFETGGCDPLARVAEQWLQGLDDALIAGCPTADPPRDLLASPDPGRTVAWERVFERQTYDRLEALVRERPAGCVQRDAGSPGRAP